MALPKKQLREKLSELGIPEENLATAVDYILTGHTASTDALKDQLDQYKADAESLPNVRKQLDEATEKLNAAPDVAAIQKQFDDYKAQVEAQKTTAQKTALLTQQLKDAGVARESALKALIKAADLDTISVKDGKLENADAVIAPLKAEFADFFGTVDDQGVPPLTPPAGGGSGETDPEKMSYAEYKAWRAKQEDKGE